MNIQNKVLSKTNLIEIVFLILLFTSISPMTALVQGNKYLAVITRAIMIACWLIFIIFRIRSKIKIFKYEIIFIIICAIAFCAAIINQSTVALDFIQPVSLFISFLGISSYVILSDIDKAKIHFFLKIFIFISLIHFIGMLVISWHEIISLFFSNEYTLNTLRRAGVFNGIMTNSNVFAYQFLPGIFSSISLLNDAITNYKTNKNKIIYYLFFTLLFGSIILLTMSRSALLAISSFLIFYYIFKPKNNRKKLLLSKKLLISIAICCVFFIALSIKFSLFTNILNKTIQKGTTYRTVLWEEFIKNRIAIFPDIKFFIGEGFKSFRETVYTFHPIKAKHVHNLFLFIWGRYGFISLILFFYFMVEFIKKNFKLKHLWYISIIPFVLIIRDMFEVDIISGTFRWEMIYFWLMLLIPYHYKNEQITKSSHISGKTEQPE